MIRYVVGAPGSGKSTFVRNHRQPNEIVIDFDVLARAFGSDVVDHHVEEHDPAVMRVTHAAWVAAVRQAQTIAESRDVWIVRANPTPTELHIMNSTGIVITMDPIEAAP